MNIPSGVQASDERRRLHSVLASEFACRHWSATVGNGDVVAAILLLLTDCRPSHVAGLVVAIRVREAIEAVPSRRLWADIAKKYLKGLPFGAYLDAAASIVHEARHVRVRASLTHSRPRDVLGCLPVLSSGAVNDHLCAELSSQASTGHRLAPEKIRAERDGQCTAITATLVAAMMTSPCSGADDNETSEAVVRCDDCHTALYRVRRMYETPLRRVSKASSAVPVQGAAVRRANASGRRSRPVRAMSSGAGQLIENTCR